MKIIEKIDSYLKEDQEYTHPLWLEEWFNILSSIDEQADVRAIKVTHPGILEVPAGKSVTSLPLSHFESLAKKKGRGAIVRALLNLYRWNKKANPKLSKWAKDMQEKLSKKLG